MKNYLDEIKKEIDSADSAAELAGLIQGLSKRIIAFIDADMSDLNNRVKAIAEGISLAENKMWELNKQERSNR